MTTERDELRKVFFEAWRKYQLRSPIEPLESQLINIILLHPEYHALLSQPDNLQVENFNETNPFLHMSLHLAIREQVATNRPPGIQQIHQHLCEQFNDVHNAEHHMMECLADILWHAQQSGKMPDEQVYLERLKKL
ncbi:MAG: DUF1841 family protein [Gammaproteobacteria bacterium]|nr:DUF1841 family protein [Gammaproteobacteria bacterium]